MRLFIAVEVADDVRMWCARARRAIESRRPFAARGLRWVSPEAMHLTLRFLGETTEPETARLREALETPFTLGPFDLRFSGLAWLPPVGRPRVLMIEAAEGADRLRALRDHVDATVHRSLGVPPEGRGFVAHLTLARVREQGASAVAAARNDVLEAPGHAPPLWTRVDRVTLFNSELSPRGPKYTALTCTRLGTGHADG